MRFYLPVLIVAVFGAGIYQAAGSVADTKAESLLQEAERYAADGELDQALAAYRELSVIQPGSSLIHARIGGMHLLKQEYEASIKSFQTAIGLDAKSNGEAFIGLGIAYLHLGKYGPARAALGEAQRLRPESAGDLNHLVSWLDARSSSGREVVQP